MAAGLEPLVVFWSGWGIHITVLMSFAVQMTLLLLADLRRRVDWPVLKVIIWSAYMLADTTAIYALGHLSVVVRLPEHRLMALWAPLLLVHLGGQDNITAYAIEDNRLWLRHLQTFGVQLLATGYVLYASSILFHPSLLRLAAILMFVVGVLKYGERVWALMGADSCASSSLSATSYKDFGAASESDEVNLEGFSAGPASQSHEVEREAQVLVIAYSLLDVPKQMFEGPTPYVKIENVRSYEGGIMLKVVEMQLTMMYDLLYTKAAVVHTWYGFLVRVISLPFTVAAALLLFHALSDQDGYRRADVVVTKVLLSGAVVLETMSVLRAVFSMWTAALLYERKWYKLGRVVQLVELVSVIRPMMRLVRREGYWSGRMGQHDLFKVLRHTKYSTCSKFAKRIGREDLWNSTFNSWSTRVPVDIIDKVLELVLTTIEECPKNKITEDGQIDITVLRGRNALRRHSLALEGDLAWSVELDLDESILVWHIATRDYLDWFRRYVPQATTQGSIRVCDVLEAPEALSNYMLFLLAARPYMLPYPVTRQRYVQLCHDLLPQLFPRKRTAQQPNIYKIRGGMESSAHLEFDTTNNTTLGSGRRLALKLIGTASEGGDAGECFTNANGILNTIFEVWVEMLCYTAYRCSEKSHAKNLTSGGELMTIVAFMMVYTSNGFIYTRNKGAPGSSSA